MPEPLVSNGVFAVPLFHGTSTLFLDSIQSHGLGGVNPIEAYAIRQFVRDVYSECDRLWSGDAEWDACKFSPKWLAEQECFGENGNFQHGDTYLTPSRGVAVGYALTNEFGSELLSMGAKLLTLAVKRDAGLLDRCAFRECPAMRLISSEPKPVLVTVRNVPVETLLSEGGEPPGKQIKTLEELLPFLKNVSAMNINFRLRHALPPSQLDVEYLDPGAEVNPFDW